MSENMEKFKEVLGIPQQYNRCCAFMPRKKQLCNEEIPLVSPTKEDYLDSLVLEVFSKSSPKQQESSGQLTSLARALICGPSHELVVPYPNGALSQVDYLVWTFQNRIENWWKMNSSEGTPTKRKPAIPQHDIVDIASTLQTLSLGPSEEPGVESLHPTTTSKEPMRQSLGRNRGDKIKDSVVEVFDVFETAFAGAEKSSGPNQSSRWLDSNVFLEHCPAPALDSHPCSSEVSTPFSGKSQSLLSPRLCDAGDLGPDAGAASTPMTDYSSDSGMLDENMQNGQNRMRYEDQPSPAEKKGQRVRMNAERSSSRERGGRQSTNSHAGEGGPGHTEVDELTNLLATVSVEDSARKNTTISPKPSRRDRMVFVLPSSATKPKGRRSIGSDANGEYIRPDLRSVELIEFMRVIVRNDDNRPGYVYCFDDPASQGHLKIGSAKFSKGRDPTDKPAPDRLLEDKDLQRRLKEHKNDCLVDLDIKFVVHMPCAAARMERLIHRTLVDEKRHVAKGTCTSSNCHKKHIEWFQVTVEEALDVAKKWEAFSSLNPYREDGALDKPWSDYADSRCKTFPDLTGKQWVNQHLVRLTGLEKKRQSAKDLSKKLFQLNKALTEEWREYKQAAEELGVDPALRQGDSAIDDLTESYSRHHLGLDLS